MAVAAAVVLSAIVGCGGANSGGAAGLRTLGSADVRAIPAGTAVGYAYSGSYIVASGGIDHCQCRRGACATSFSDAGKIVEVTQNDGMLTITTGDPAPWNGGVDDDGTFHVDVKVEQSNETMFGIQTGQFVAADAGGYLMTISEQATVTFPMNGIDCDFTATLHVQPL